jgi:alginate O-acetyltransferase complex protein AlgI
MLFNSYIFIFVFLPATWLIYSALRQRSRELALASLVGASIIYYGWWDVRYVWLIISSVTVNYALGRAISGLVLREKGVSASFAVFLGVAFNLGLLGYYKYAGFFVETVNDVAGVDWAVPNIVLPIGISFFTFQQIAFLVDARRLLTKEYSFLHYLLFVAFFPQLIAGPIVHHKELVPQFMRGPTRPDARLLAVGITMFVIGLFKKTVLADTYGATCRPIFDGPTEALAFHQAWLGTLSYSLQIYFDFSGYCDMALGLACMFGVRLPANFDSPYKSRSIIEFWRRWHITLSRFLRDYVYIPLGGNRHGEPRRYFNIFATMTLGGIWHGAGWTFLVWGLFHSVMICLDHLWQDVRQRIGRKRKRPWYQPDFVSVGVVFILVSMAWVVFRSPDVATAGQIYCHLLGMEGVVLPDSLQKYCPEIIANFARFSGRDNDTEWLWVIVGLSIVWFFPNSQQIVRGASLYAPIDGYSPRLSWQPSIAWGLVTIALFLTALLNMSSLSEFLYYQF